MKTFEQKLNQFISDNAMEYSKNLSDGEYNPKKYRYSIHGGQSLKPIVMKLYEALKKLKQDTAYGNQPNGALDYAEDYVARIKIAEQALAEVENMIGGEK